MNDETNLDLYSQLLLFRNDILQDELLFYGPDKSRQRSLQALAHKLGLECEYSLGTQTVRISRSPQSPGQNTDDFDPWELSNFGLTKTFNHNQESPGAFGFLTTANINPVPEVPSSFTAQAGHSFGGPCDIKSRYSLHGRPFPHWPAFGPNVTSNTLPLGFEAVLNEAQHRRSPIYQSPHRRSKSISSSNINDMITETGITIEDIATFIKGPDLVDGKWNCLYPDCQMRFGRKENIKSHVQTHLGDRQFQCPHCKKCFIRQHDMKRHAKIHSIQKRYSCLCGSSFARNDALTRHRQRGMCVGAFEGLIKRVVKRGRPRKHISSTEGALSYASSESSLITTPDLDKMSGVESSRLFGDLERLPDAPSQSRSRQDSSHSLQRDQSQSRWKTMFGRKSSIHSAASSGYREIVFDSGSVHSGSHVSNTSAASGRRGPLTEAARAGMKVLKKLGACWRCKFLRKTVSLAIHFQGILLIAR